MHIFVIKTIITILNKIQGDTIFQTYNSEPIKWYMNMCLEISMFY